MTTPTTNSWLRAFLLRILFAIQLAAAIPLACVGMLLSPVWWLFSGKTINPPKWMCRLLDGDGY